MTTTIQVYELRRAPTCGAVRCPPCGLGGSPIDWVIKTNGVSFRHAVEMLREGVPASSLAAKPVKQSTVPKLPAPVSLEADDQALLNQVIDYYHATRSSWPSPCMENWRSWFRLWLHRELWPMIQMTIMCWPQPSQPTLI